MLNFYICSTFQFALIPAVSYSVSFLQGTAAKATMGAHAIVHPFKL